MKKNPFFYQLTTYLPSDEQTKHWTSKKMGTNLWSSLYLFALWWTETGREELRIARNRETQSPSCIININITLSINFNIYIETNIDIKEARDTVGFPHH